jgi:hypothetical protein
MTVSSVTTQVYLSNSLHQRRTGGSSLGRFNFICKLLRESFSFFDTSLLLLYINDPANEISNVRPSLGEDILRFELKYS